MKRSIAFAIAALAAASLITGCSKDTGQAAADTAAADSEEGEASGEGGKTLETADISKYITLGNYKGLKLTLQDTTVSDGDVKEAEKNALSVKKYREPVTDRGAEIGDTVNIDYVGKKDGEAFQGGTAEGRDLDLGSGTFIPGFEDGLVGAKPGETRELDLTFPENYQKAELAGQDAVFTVTVNSVSENIVPELTDEIAKELNPEVSTVKEFRDRLRKALEESREASAKAKAFGELLSEVQNDSEIKPADKLPDWLMDGIKAEQKENFETSLQMYGIDLQTYLAQQGMTEKDFDETLEAYSASIAAQQLVVQALANAENIKVTEEDLKKQYEEDAASYGYKTGEEFEAAIKKQNAEQTFRDATLTRKVEEMLLNYADIENPEMLHLSETK